MFLLAFLAILHQGFGAKICPEGFLADGLSVSPSVRIKCSRPKCQTDDVFADTNDCTTVASCRHDQYVAGIEADTDKNFYLRCCRLHASAKVYSATHFIPINATYRGIQNRKLAKLILFDYISNIRKERFGTRVWIYRLTCANFDISTSLLRSRSSVPRVTGQVPEFKEINDLKEFEEKEETEQVESDQFLVETPEDLQTIARIDNDVNEFELAVRENDETEHVESDQLLFENNEDLQTISESETQDQMHGSFPACFSRDSMVSTTKGSKPIESVEVGDHVLSIENGRLLYSPVLLILHRLPDEPAKFIHLHTTVGVLSVTSKHLMLVSNCSHFSTTSQYAEDVQVGQCLTAVNEDRLSLVMISEISHSIQNGIYAPYTRAGTIVVNGMAASCHSNVKDEALANFFLITLSWAEHIWCRIFGPSQAEEVISLPKLAYFFHYLSGYLY